MKRVYICHTFYHAYVAIMKELNFGINHRGEATLILSTMSNNFDGMKERAENSGVFKDVYYYEEKEDITSSEVMSYHKDKGNLFLNLLQRIKYTKLLGKLQEEYIPVDLKKYDEVYVFCDSDPIGYYLNYKKIKYHALEDGLNSGRLDNQARLSNQGAFGLKCFMAKLGLIFIESGYSRYCIDYEVNDISQNYLPPKNIIECAFDSMHEKLTDDDKRILIHIFAENPEELMSLYDSADERPVAMILTEPLCELDIRKKLFKDIVNDLGKNTRIIIKPHPRDLLNYEEEFKDAIVIKGRFPMEILNDIPSFRVNKLISVITQVDCISFADEVIYLGLDFLDKYEDPSIHRKMENLKAQSK